MSFSLLPFTYTNHCNCFLLWFCFDCASSGKPPSKPNKETMGPCYHRRWMGVYFVNISARWNGNRKRGRISRCQLKSNNPSSCQWSSISMSMRTDVSPSVEGLVESRTAWVRLKVADTFLLPQGLEGRKRNSLAHPFIHTNYCTLLDFF